MRKGLLPIVGGVIQDVFCPPSRLQPITYEPPPRVMFSILRDLRIQCIERRGKRLAFLLDKEYVLVIEPRMTGRLLLDPEPLPSHVRLVMNIAVPTGSDDQADASVTRTLVFRDVRGLGVVRLIKQDACGQVIGEAALGPDALAISWQDLRDRLGQRRAAIKIALMDQKAVAGVGNIYASEALHRAKIHPARPCHTLTARQWQRLHAALQQVLHEAIEQQGSTLADQAYTTPGNNPGRFQDQHRVYQRDGKRCLQCRRGIIRRIILGQRSTFFCPVCQRMRPGS